MPVLDLGSVVGPAGPQGATGPQGGQGVQGDPGPAATINGFNALTITAGDNVTLRQEGAELEIGASMDKGNIEGNLEALDDVITEGTYTWLDQTGEMGFTGSLWILVVERSDYFGNPYNRAIAQTLTCAYGGDKERILTRVYYYANNPQWTHWRESGGQNSNPNLLINSDFRKPVNRNGKTEYIGSTYSIDRWVVANSASRIATEDGFVRLDTASKGFGRSIKQTVEDASQLYGKTVTFSCLAKSVESTEGLYIAIFMAPQKSGTAKRIAASDLVHAGNYTLLSCTCTIPDEVNVQENKEIVAFIGYSNNDTGLTVNTADLIAARLELGDNQTLARQNAGGEWEIIDPIDYDTQYLLCSQYSPITGEWVGSQHSNKNLLDNWYFLDPVNQMAQTAWETGINFQYFIDRWYTARTKLSLTSEGLSFAWDGVNGNDGWIQEKIAEKTYIGKIVTVSALVDGQLCSFSTRVPTANNQSSYSGLINNKTVLSVTNHGGWGISATITTKLTTPQIIKATKLELGPVQTLAHREGDTWVLNDPPPNKALELAKCQRYFRTIKEVRAYSAQSGKEFLPVSLYYPPMRINPVVTLHGNICAENDSVLQGVSFVSGQFLTDSADSIRVSGNTYAGWLKFKDVWLDANL